MTVTGKDSREVAASIARLELCAGMELSDPRKAAIVTTLRERYTDAEIIQAMDTLRFTWKPAYGQGLATCDVVDVLEGTVDARGKLYTYNQVLDEYAKIGGGGAGRAPMHELYELVEMDGGPKWRKR